MANRKTTAGAMVPFAFDMRQKVVIIASGKTGEVRGLWLDENANRWVRVMYVNEIGSVCEDWFVEGDMSLLPQQTKGRRG